MPVDKRDYGEESGFMAFSERRRDAARVKMGKIFRDARLQKDIRAMTLAERLPRDCDANQLYYWERGRRTPDPDRVEALIRILDLPGDEVWDLWREASMRKPKMPRKRELVSVSQPNGAAGAGSDWGESWETPDSPSSRVRSSG